MFYIVAQKAMTGRAGCVLCNDKKWRTFSPINCFKEYHRKGGAMTRLRQFNIGSLEPRAFILDMSGGFILDAALNVFFVSSDGNDCHVAQIKPGKIIRMKDKVSFDMSQYQYIRFSADQSLDVEVIGVKYGEKEEGVVRE